MCIRDRNFTFLAVVGVAVSLVLLVIVLLFHKPIVYALGADDSLFENGKTYLIDMMYFGPVSYTHLEEIFTPELVKEGSLCPHQDYVYFNWPTREEEAYVREHQKRMQMQVQKMMADETLRRIVSSHQGLMHPEERCV